MTPTPCFTSPAYIRQRPHLRSVHGLKGRHAAALTLSPHPPEEELPGHPYRSGWKVSVHGSRTLFLMGVSWTPTLTNPCDEPFLEKPTVQPQSESL